MPARCLHVASIDEPHIAQSALDGTEPRMRAKFLACGTAGAPELRFSENVRISFRVCTGFVRISFGFALEKLGLPPVQTSNFIPFSFGDSVRFACYALRPLESRGVERSAKHV